MGDRWFRVYENMVDDPKVQRLSADLFRALVNLWCIASKNGGKLPCLGDIAYTLRIREDRVQKILAELKACDLLDGDDDLAPHNWNGRQYKTDVVDPTNAERQQRHRDKKRYGAVTEPLRPPVTQTTRDRTDTEQITDTESEQSRLPESIKKLSVNLGGEGVKKKKPPSHGAFSKDHVYISADSQEWGAYAQDYYNAHQRVPKPNDDGGKWFKKAGEQPLPAPKRLTG